MKAVPLAVSGAFHTPLMQPAREALIEVPSPCCQLFLIFQRQMPSGGNPLPCQHNLKTLYQDLF